MRDIAAWLVDVAGYPFDFQFSEFPPAPLWEAIVDYIYEDQFGHFHGNELTRDEVDEWLRNGV